MTIRLLTLGGLHGSLDGAELERLGARGLSAALLVYLAVERTATRDALMALLWPEQDAEAAGHRLSQMLYSLRRELGETCVKSQGREVRACDCVEADAVEFEHAVNAGRMAEAIPLYAGPFLDGVHLAATPGFETWTDTVRARCARFFRRACKAQVEERLTAGDLPAAIATARAWLAPDPLDDEAQHRLIELLARGGERLEALKQYATYSELLESEGLEPLDETKELVRRIRESRSLGARESAPAADPERDLDARVRDGLAPDLEVLRLLGHGSTASVYLAREPALARLVAVKVLSPRWAADEVARKRFQREARAAASIVHANIAQIYRLSLLDGLLPFILMEYVDGRSVAELLATRGVFPQSEARKVLRAVASALAAAHERRVIHRDVSAGNILVESRTGRPVLTDFGIAALLESGGDADPRLTPAGFRLGNTRYMSPEQARDDALTDLSDVYALGVVAFEMLTGEHPFRVASPDQFIIAHLKHEPRPVRALLPDVAADLSTFVDRCLAKTPEQRPRAADAAVLLAAGD